MKDTITVTQKKTRTKMTKEELEKYMNEVRKSAHTFRSKKDYNRQTYKKEEKE